MKNVLLSLILLLGLTSCLANKVNNDTLMPMARDIWPNVRVDYSRGLDDGVVKGDLSTEQRSVLESYADRLGTALKNANVVELMSLPWDTVMRPWADRGIAAEVAAGELGINGAKILFQRVENFTNVIVTIQGKVVGLFNPRVVTDARLSQLVDHRVRVWANN